MTDEKLDQILKQALAPEISDKEILTYKRRKDQMKKDQMKKDQMKKDQMKRFARIGKGMAAAAAAAVIGIGGLGYFHPVLAAKLPLIGRIFERVGDDATYSGDYTDKKTVLTNENDEGVDTCLLYTSPSPRDP